MTVNTIAELRRSRGFTLVEVMIVTALMAMVLIIASQAFNTILRNATKLTKSEESNIEGVIGLELFRHDLQQAGYGLFTEPFAYASEAVDALPALANDVGNVPRPLVFQNNLGGGLSVDSIVPLSGSDYIAIKGTSLSRAAAAQKWTFLNITTKNVTTHPWASGAENFANNDKVVVLRKQFVNAQRSTLTPSPSGDFYYTYANSAFANLSSQASGMYAVYGIDSGTPRFPFNRTDYFVAVPGGTATLPASCAPGTGVLYKAIVGHSDGKFSSLPIPILDCVLDMQVVLGWDTDGDGMIDTWSNADGSLAPVGCQSCAQAALGTANNNSISTQPNIRSNLKMIKVYILAQVGKRDTTYTSPSPINVCDAGETSITRPGGLTLTADQKNYRWKLYRLVVRPRNLLANQ